MAIEDYHVLITKPLFALNVKRILRMVDCDVHHQAQFLNLVIAHVGNLVNLVPIGHCYSVEIQREPHINSCPICT